MQRARSALSEPPDPSSPLSSTTKLKTAGEQPPSAPDTPTNQSSGLPRASSSASQHSKEGDHGATAVGADGRRESMEGDGASRLPSMASTTTSSAGGRRDSAVREGKRGGRKSSMRSDAGGHKGPQGRKVSHLSHQSDEGAGNTVSRTASGGSESPQKPKFVARKHRFLNLGGADEEYEESSSSDDPWEEKTAEFLARREERRRRRQERRTIHRGKAEAVLRAQVALQISDELMSTGATPPARPPPPPPPPPPRV